VTVISPEPSAFGVSVRLPGHQVRRDLDLRLVGHVAGDAVGRGHLDDDV
jgi:hypothetical protein